MITLSAITFPSVQPGERCWCAFRDGPAPALLRRHTDTGFAYVSRAGRRGQWLTREIRVERRDVFRSFGAASVAYVQNRQLRQQAREAVRYWRGELLAMAELRAEAETRGKIPSKPGRPSKGVGA